MDEKRGANRIVYFALLGITYLSLARLDVAIGSIARVASVSMSSGVAFAGVYLLGPWAAAAIAVADLAQGILLGGLDWQLAPSVAGNALAPLAGVLLMRRFLGRHFFADHPWYMLLFLLPGAGAQACVASVGWMANLGMRGVLWGGNFEATWWSVFSSRLIGVVVFSPAILAWQRKRLDDTQNARVGELAPVLAGVLSVGWLVFGRRLDADLLRYPLPLAMLPFMIWAAVRLDLRALSLTVLVAAAASVTGTSLGYGPFAGNTLTESLLPLQSFIGVMACITLILHASVRSWRRAESRLRRSRKALRRANRELRDLDRLKTSFMAVTSHELRTPLMCVCGTLDIIFRRKDRLAVDRRIEEYLETARRGAARLRNITARSLEVLERGEFKREMSLEWCDPGDVARRVVDEVHPFVDTRNQQLEVDISTDLPTVSMDPAKIHDVLHNLLINAVKFTPDGGVIRLEVARHSDAGWVSMRVRDSGVGVDPKDLPHIFKRFFTSFDTLSHSSGEYEFDKRGLGLGLAIVRDFTEMHGGRVEVVSQRGEGSVFEVVLPIGGPTQRFSPEDGRPAAATGVQN